MVRTIVEKKVKEIIFDRLGISMKEIADKATLVDNLSAESIDITELIVFMEDEFNIKIPDKDVEKIITVGDMVDYTLKHCKKNKKKV